MSKISDRAAGGYQAARDGIRDARQSVGDRADELRDGYTNVQDNISHVSDDLSDYVRHNPGRSVLFAAGFGFLIGLLLRGFKNGN